MNMKVSDIFREKLASIQSRLPVKISGNQETDSFETMLQNQIASIAENTYKSSSKYYPPSSTMQDIQNAIAAASEKYNLNPKLISAVIKAESGFNPYARSRAGAEGLMQLMPSTAKALGVTDTMDIYQNIDGGSKYLREKLDQFNGNLRLALAAYTQGLMP